MPDPNGLDIHDVLIAHSPTFDRNGQMQTNTTITYSVGSHGPFHLLYGPGQMTADKVNADMAKQVQELRAIVVRPA